MKRTDFVISSGPEPHRNRTKQILKQHPQIRKLIGKNQYSFFAILFLVTAQITLAITLSYGSWLLIFLAAYLVGAFIDHALFVMIHECAHRLVFKNIIRSRVFMNWMRICLTGGKHDLLIIPS